MRDPLLRHFKTQKNLSSGLPGSRSIPLSSFTPAFDDGIFFRMPYSVLFHVTENNWFKTSVFYSWKHFSAQNKGAAPILMRR